MARVNWFEPLGPHGDLGEFYADAVLALDRATAGTAIYVDEESGNRIRMTGHGFTYDGDAIATGTIASVTFTDTDGDVFQEIEHDRFDAARITQALERQGVEAMLKKLLEHADRMAGSGIADDMRGGQGNDRLFGHAGEDHLYGGTGFDRMTGGRGEDVFIFGDGDGKDLVTDFDEAGRDGQQDHLFLRTSSSYVTRGFGGDVVIDLEDGSTLILQDVNRAQFGNADFVIL
jgi:Ca2+-binding RTX toxin-like protein